MNDFIDYCLKAANAPISRRTIAAVVVAGWAGIAAIYQTAQSLAWVWALVTGGAK